MQIDEFYRILESENPSEAIKEKEGIVFSIIPSLRECKGYKQNGDSQIYDVYEHTMQVLDNVGDSLVLRLAALFHDLGKPKACEKDSKGRDCFPKHLFVSKIIFEAFAKRFRLDDELARQVSNLISYHNVDFASLDEDDIEEIKDTFTKEELEDLFKFKEADLAAQNLKYTQPLIDALPSQYESLASRYSSFTF